MSEGKEILYGGRVYGKTQATIDAFVASDMVSMDFLCPSKAHAKALLERIRGQGVPAVATLQRHTHKGQPLHVVVDGMPTLRPNTQITWGVRLERLR